MGAQLILKQGDTAPQVSNQLRDHSPYGPVEGSVVDLTTAAQVAVVFRHESTRQVVHSAVADIAQPPTEGIVSTPLAAEVTARPGLVSFEWVVTWQDGTQQTFPTTPRSPANYLLVRQELPMPDSIPALIAPGASSGLTVFIADDAAGDVVANGQLVLAGHNTTINVADGVTEFRVAEWTTQTGWAAGTTPTIVLAGTSLEALGPSKLAASGGDLVTVARAAGGSTWYVVGPDPTAGGAVEIGHGSALPADGSTFQFFEIEGSVAVPPLPNGLYRYDDAAGVWVQE